MFGLTPVAASGLLGLVADLCRGGTEIPLDAELVGLLDNELRCRFAHVDMEEWGALFATGEAWYRGVPFEVVQLVYPDRNGFLPYEAGLRAPHALRPTRHRHRLSRSSVCCYAPQRISSGLDVQARQPG